jgi:hypothetical protein
MENRLIQIAYFISSHSDTYYLDSEVDRLNVMYQV